MNKTKQLMIAFGFGTGLMGLLTGCVGYVDGPHHARVYAAPATVSVQSEVVVQDDYVYYPGYQVYYGRRTRQYVYLDGSAWVTRPSPPRVSVDALFASPSVRVDFHDAPAIHHANVVQQYPQHWAPPGASHGKKEGHDEGRHEGQNKEKNGNKGGHHESQNKGKKGHK